jgi:hypothetical protein
MDTITFQHEIAYIKQGGVVTHIAPAPPGFWLKPGTFKLPKNMDERIKKQLVALPSPKV